MKGVVMTDEELIKLQYGRFSTGDGKEIYADKLGLTITNKLVAIVKNESQLELHFLENTSKGFKSIETKTGVITNNPIADICDINKTLNADDKVTTVLDIDNVDTYCNEGCYYPVKLAIKTKEELVQLGIITEEVSCVLLKVFKIGKIDPSFPRRTKYVGMDDRGVLYSFWIMHGVGLETISFLPPNNMSLDQKLNHFKI